MIIIGQVFVMAPFCNIITQKGLYFTFPCWYVNFFLRRVKLNFYHFKIWWRINASVYRVIIASAWKKVKIEMRLKIIFARFWPFCSALGMPWCWWNLLTSANHIPQIRSHERSSINIPDLGGTDVWPEKIAFIKCKKIHDIAVFFITFL